MNLEIKKFEYTATFDKKVEVAPETFELHFNLDEELVFEAGQYVWLKLPVLKNDDKKGDRRAMSILNIYHPNEKKIVVLMRKGVSSYKKQIMELTPGDKVDILGPFGLSFLLPEDDSEVVMISGGVGVAPFVSLCRESVVRKTPNKMSVVSVNSPDKPVLYADEISKIQKVNKNLTAYFLNEKPDGKFFKNNFNTEDATFYISGPQGFVNYVYGLLVKLGVGPNRMKFENYYPTDESAEMLLKAFTKSVADKNNVYSSSDILMSAVQSSSHHIIVTDTNGNIVFANAAAERITGFPFEEMIGNTPRLWGGLMSPEFYKKLWLCKLRGELIDEEIINHRKNGEIYYVISHIAPIRDDKQKIIGYVATEEDITYIKEQEQKLLETTNELKRFNNITVDRELKMIDLKNEIDELKKKLNEKK